MTHPLSKPSSEITTDLPTPSCALAVGAHPDDIEFGAGATLAKWAADGCRIVHLVCTDGSKGSWDPTEDTAKLVASRQEEQRAASRALGGTGEVIFLGWTDGELDSSLRQRWEVAYWIRMVKPDVVLGHDPWKRYRLHPDHRHAGLLAVEGIVAARDPHFFPEQSIPHHRPDALLLWEADEVNHVELVDGFAEKKFAALMEHRSQLRSTMFIDDVSNHEQVASFRQRMMDRLADHGSHVGAAAGEAFHLISNL
ncbi:MAG TPA: PIG-L deacetylase family protein [Acidimicrobiales bacterium]|jgi:LmbE family N-acetylglucosaminyl deacetylase|nr:PIG-L deacetylase family protein [Acidimicrobiales bacterium]